MESLEESFRELYDTALQGPVAEVLEFRKQKRAESLKLLRNTGIAAVVCVPPALLIPSLGGFRIALGIIPAAFLIFSIWRYFTGKKEVRRLFKARILTKIVSAIDPELSFDQDNCISESDFRSTGLFQERIDRYSGEDCVSGSYHGVKLIFSEIHAEYKTESVDGKGHRTTTWHDIFKGVFLIADFQKDFNTRTFVVPDVAENLFGQMLGNFLQKLNLVREGRIIRMENPEFEKYYAVYAHDDVEARYLLSPSLMERMVELRKRFDSQISFSFTDSCMNIAIPSARDFFEMPDGNLDYDSLKRCLSEFLFFLRIVDELNLNVRIWSKE